MSTLGNGRCPGFPDAELNKVGSWRTYPPCFGSVERFDLQLNLRANVPAHIQYQDRGQLFELDRGPVVIGRVL